MALPTRPTSTTPSLPSPVSADALAAALVRHPDREFVTYLYDGFTNGFNIGYRGTRRSLHTPNCASAFQHSDEITAAISKEVSLGRTIGPFDWHPFPNFVTSALGAAAKSSGGYRLTLDLSRPFGESVNDGISGDDFALEYSRVDDAVRLIVDMGGSPFMAKSDIKAAFRQCPVRPRDYPLLGFEWQGRYYYDAVLPFGLCSAPFIFAQLATALHWITCQRTQSNATVQYNTPTISSSSTPMRLHAAPSRIRLPPSLRKRVYLLHQRRTFARRNK